MYLRFIYYLIHFFFLDFPDYIMMTVLSAFIVPLSVQTELVKEI